MKFAPALGLGALSLGTPAWAQDTAPERRFDIGASAASTYDSNFLRIPDNSLFGLGQERDEVRVTPSLTVDLQLPLGRQSVYLSGAAGYDFYANNKDLNRERIQLGGGGTLRFARCGTRFGVTFSRQQSDLADIPEPIAVKNAETRWLFDGGMNCRFGAGLAPSLGYQHERVENSDGMRQSGNYSADTVRAGLNYARPGFGDLSANFSHRRGRYDERQIAPGRQERVDTSTAGITFTRLLGSQLTGSVAGGWTKVNPNLPGVRGFSGLSYAVDLAWRPGSRLKATLGAGRQAQQSNLLGISYAIVDDYRLDLTYALGDRLRLSALANHKRRSLRDSALTPGAVLREEDKSYRLGAAATYSPNYRLTVSLDASRESRRSTNALFSYDNFMVALTTRLNV